MWEQQLNAERPVRWLSVLVLPLVAWLLAATPPGQALDDECYRWASQLRSQFAAAPARVVIVHGTRMQLADPAALGGLLGDLRRHGARAVAIAAAPVPLAGRSAAGRSGESPLGAENRVTKDCQSGSPAGVLRNANAWEKVYWGVPCQRNAVDPARWELSRSPETPRWGVLHLPESLRRRGLGREQSRRVRVGSRVVPTLEAAVAEALGLTWHAASRSPANGRGVDAGDYLIDYRRGPRSLPHFRWEDVRADAVPSQMFAGRAVVVGAEPIDGVTVPVPGGEVTALEFHAHALNTLLAGRAATVLPPLLVLVIATFVSVSAICVFLRLPAGKSWLAVGAGALACWLGGAAALTRCGWWMPQAPLLGCLLLAWLLVLVRKAALGSERTTSLAMELSARMRRRTWPRDPGSVDDPWEYLGGLAAGWLGPRRMILLEAGSSQSDVRPVVTLHCDGEAIATDWKAGGREPFLAAVRGGRPVPLERGQLFIDDGGPEDLGRYLAPLIDQGSLFGFLAVELAGTGNDPNLSSQLAELARELARVRNWQLRLEGERRRWWRADQLGRTPEDRGHRALAEAIRAGEQRLGRLEQLFDQGALPTAVFDLSGQLLMVNRGMNELAQERHVLLSEGDAAALVAALCGTAVSDVRARLRAVLLSTEPAQLEVPPSESDPLGGSVRITAVGDPSCASGEFVTPFDLLGVRVEWLPAGTPAYAGAAAPGTLRSCTSWSTATTSCPSI